MLGNRNSEENLPIHSSTETGYNSIQGRVTPTRSSSGSEPGYTELLSGSVPCPTCRGLGNVPKEQEGQLIALIPMKDKRLKPTRTYLWVGLAILLCVTAAGLLVFFMFPRDVVLTSTRPYLDPVGSVTVNVTKQYVNFEIINYVTVTNHNYFPIDVTSVEMTVQYDTIVLDTAKNSSVLKVPIRSEKQYFVQTNITLDKQNQMGYMAFTCNYSYMGHTEQATLQTFQFVSCYSKNITDVSLQRQSQNPEFTVAASTPS